MERRRAEPPERNNLSGTRDTFHVEPGPNRPRPKVEAERFTCSTWNEGTGRVRHAGCLSSPCEALEGLPHKAFARGHSGDVFHVERQG